MKTRLIFVRHGEARGNVDRVFHGFVNSELTENGRRQIQRAAERLAEEQIDFFYSSDLKRAYETACAVAKPRGKTVEIEPDFREINGGKWENKRWDDLPKLFPDSFPAWETAPHQLDIPGGETMISFCNRLTDAVTRVVNRHPGKTILIATHGAALRTLCCYFKAKPLTELNEVAWCDNAAITIVEYENNTFTMIVEGDNRHITDISSFMEQDWWKH